MGPLSLYLHNQKAHFNHSRSPKQLSSCNPWYSNASRKFTRKLQELNIYSKQNQSAISGQSLAHLNPCDVSQKLVSEHQQPTEAEKPVLQLAQRGSASKCETVKGLMSKQLSWKRQKDITFSPKSEEKENKATRARHPASHALTSQEPGTKPADAHTVDAHTVDAHEMDAHTVDVHTVDAQPKGATGVMAPEIRETAPT